MKNDWTREDSYEYYSAEPSPYSYAPSVKTRPRKRGRLFHWLFQIVPETEDEILNYQLEAQVREEDDPLQAQRIKEALQAWKDSVAYFENVSDPALIDYAVYDMEAAQKRYMFLLRSARIHDWPRSRIRT